MDLVQYCLGENQIGSSALTKCCKFIEGARCDFLQSRKEDSSKPCCICRSEFDLLNLHTRAEGRSFGRGARETRDRFSVAQAGRSHGLARLALAQGALGCMFESRIHINEQ